MLATAAFSTGKRYVPTGSILIALSWSAVKVTTCSAGLVLDAESVVCDGLVSAGWPHPDTRSTVANAIAANFTATDIAFTSSVNKSFMVKLDGPIWVASV